MSSAALNFRYGSKAVVRHASRKPDGYPIVGTKMLNLEFEKFL